MQLIHCRHVYLCTSHVTSTTPGVHVPLLDTRIQYMHAVIGSGSIFTSVQLLNTTLSYCIRQSYAHGAGAASAV